MIPALENNLSRIADACERFQVERLEVFGSATTGAFDSATSDVDFLVRYRPGADLGPWLSRHLELKAELERIMERPVDLVMASARQRASVSADIEASRKLLYAA